MSPKQKFVDGEKVLCFHGPLIYEAKALKSTITKDKQIKYYIHYAGWNKNWDEWVPEYRVLKYNEANVQKQDELFKQHKSISSKNKKGTSKSKKSDSSGSIKDSTISGGSESRASTPSKEVASILCGASSSTNVSRNNRSKQIPIPLTNEAVAKKDEIKDELIKDEKEEGVIRKKRGSVISEKCNVSSTSNYNSSYGSNGSGTPIVSSTTFVEGEENYYNKVEVKIRIPDELKQCLADDWDAITRQHKLHDVPARTTVQDIIDQYVAHKKSVKSTSATKELAISDVLNGIIEYFNVMLGSQLLYKFERHQYAEILQQRPEVPLSKLYGGFHLLRLFVRLGSMLCYSALDEKAMQMLLIHLHDFLKYLAKNCNTLFNMSNFVNASPEYHRQNQ